MAEKGYFSEPIINKLSDAEVIILKGGAASHTALRSAVTEKTRYRWRKKHEGRRGARPNASQVVGMQN